MAQSAAGASFAKVHAPHVQGAAGAAAAGPPPLLLCGTAAAAVRGAAREVAGGALGTAPRSRAEKPSADDDDDDDGDDDDDDGDGDLVRAHSGEVGVVLPRLRVGPVDGRVAAGGVVAPEQVPGRRARFFSFLFFFLLFFITPPIAAAHPLTGR